MKRLALLIIFMPLFFSCNQKKENIQQPIKTEDIETEKSLEHIHNVDSIEKPKSINKWMQDPVGNPTESGVQKTCHCNCSCGTVSIYPCDDNCDCCVRACKKKCKD
tara:strand:+ start:1026 stop:1343 length:318 start_codon:yes stop_codon:yes gene_type:complete